MRGDGKLHGLPQWLRGNKSASNTGDAGSIPGWRREWQPTPVFLPAESHGQRRLARYSPSGRKQSDTTEATEHVHVGNCIDRVGSRPKSQRRQWHPTPVFLPGESQGWGSLVGCGLCGRRVRHDWSDLAAAALSQPDCNPMSRDKQEYPVFCGVRFLSSHLLKMLPLQVLAFVHRSWIKHTHTHACTHTPPPSGCNLYPVLSQVEPIPFALGHLFHHIAWCGNLQIVKFILVAHFCAAIAERAQKSIPF